MSKNITGKVLAIQLGREESQVVLLDGGEILRAVSVQTPAGAVDDGMIRNPDAVRGMLKEVLTDSAFRKTRRAVFTLCTSQVITETVTTPDLPEAKLGKLLRANADMYFPVDTQEYHLVWQVVGPKYTEGGIKELAVQLWAVPSAMVKPYYAVANACGLSVEAIDYCGHSMASAAGAAFVNTAKAGREKKKVDLNKELSFGKKKAESAEAQYRDEDTYYAVTDLHLMLDRELLGMTFVRNGRVVMQRIVRCGSDPTYQFGELAMMLEYFHSMESGRGSTINGIVSGFYAEDERIVAELADMLGISVVLLDADYDLRWSMCVGAANTDLDFGIPSLNAPGKGRREVRSQLWQYGLILIGGLAVLAVVLYTLSARLYWNADLGALQAQQQTLTIQAGESAGFADNYYEYEKLYNSYSSDWDSVFNHLQTYNDSLVLVLDELETLLPENSSVAAMGIGASGLDVTFACETKEEAAYLIMALREMQYADLMAVSPLMGGGNGPATSYGSDEEAPSEGSSEMVDKKWLELADSVSADLEAYTVGYHLGLGVKAEDHLDELKSVFGLKELNNQYDSIGELAQKAGSALTREVRANAFTAMCTTNPFAMGAAESVLYQDYLSGGKLGPYIEKQLTARDSNIFSVYRHKSVEDLEDDIALLVEIITTPNSEYDALTEAEKLVCKDQEMEDWYIYYLEAELAKDGESDEDEKPLPYLHVDAVVSDLLDGAFNSRFDGLNKELIKLISSKTMKLVEEHNNADKPTDPTDPVAPTDPADPTDPVDPTDPANPTDPVDPTDPADPTDPTDPSAPSEPSEPSDTEDDLKAQLELLLGIYLQTGNIPGADPYLQQISKYFTEGKSGTEYDKFVDAYIATGKADGALKGQILLYRDDPEELVNSAIRKMLDNYYNNDTTGNKVLDAWIDRCEPSEEETTPSETGPSEATDGTDGSTGPGDFSDITEDAARWLKLFLTYGQTYDSNGDKTVKEYLLTGKTDNSGITDQLDSYVAGGGVDTELKTLLYYYLYNRSMIKNEPIVTLFDNYYEGTTGSAALDEQIKKLGKEIARDAINNALENVGTGTEGTGSSGGTGGSGGQQGGEQDTRIYFAVVLNYNEELRVAELNRKGLNPAEKIEPLEVEE